MLGGDRAFLYSLSDEIIKQWNLFSCCSFSRKSYGLLLFTKIIIFISQTTLILKNKR